MRLPILFAIAIGGWVVSESKNGVILNEAMDLCISLAAKECIGSLLPSE